MSGILIVEDEDIEREFLELLVKKVAGESYEVWSCVTGNEAIQLARENHPSIIFLDVLIPEKDGLSALEVIRTFLPKVQVVVLSAFSDFAYAQKAIELKVKKYLLKPANPRELTEILEELLAENESPAITDFEVQESQSSQSFVQEALQFIQKKYAEPLTLEIVSAQVFMTPQYFSRVFKKEVGVSCTEYINTLRIHHACKLLKETNYPSYRISSECGFNDPSYFNRVFCQQMGITPIKYRKKRD